MEIRIYSPPTLEVPRFVAQGLTTGATRVTLVERLYKPGHFAVEIPWGVRHAEKLAIGRLVRMDGAAWGVVDDLSLTATGAGMALKASGRQLKGLTMDRVTIPPGFSDVAGAQGYDTVNGTTETCMKHFVIGNMQNSQQLARYVHGLEIAPDQLRGTAEDRYISRHDVVGDVLETLGEASGLGYDIVPDLARHKLVFDVIQGADHSATQSQRMRVIFDIARKTAMSQDYVNNTSDSRNVFYVTKSGSEFADEALTVSYVRDGEQEAVGIGRREVHLELSADTPTAGEEYDELRRMAMLEAESFRPAESFTCEILEGGRYVYRRDFGLGDMVSIVNREWGITMHARLTEMQTEYGADGIKRVATLGTAPLNIFGRLRRQITKGR